MKILLVEPYSDRMGHSALYATKIAQELSLLGHQVVVVAGTRLETQEFLQTEPLFRLVEVGQTAAYEVGCVGASLPRTSVILPKLVRKIVRAPAVIRINLAALSRAIKLSVHEPFDVIHLLAFENISTALFLLWNDWIQQTKLPPLVVQVYPVDFSLLKHRGDILWGLYKMVSAFALRFLLHRYCKALTVQGEWHAAALEKPLASHRASKLHVVIIRPMATIPENTIPKPVARQHIRVAYQGPLFLFFGMLRAEKGIELLIEAVARADTDYKVLIAGAPFDWTADELRERIDRSRCAGRILVDVRYIPEAEVASYFFAADAVVMPYRGRNYAGGYGPMILACAYGAPLIVSDLGEMGLLVRDRRLGFAVLPDDAVALGEALDAFVRLPTAEKADMGSQAQKLAEECSFVSTTQRLSDVYSAIVTPDGTRV